MPDRPLAAAPTRRLPARPDLDQLKTRAKELQRRFDAGDRDAAAEVARHFHRDGDAPLTLAQAQLVLARSYGFDSWPKLKAHVDGVTLARLFDAVEAGDRDTARGMLRRRPELVHMDRAADDEHRVLHVAVLRRDAAMVRLLMEHDADARKGIHPHRDATSAWRLAHDRGCDDVREAIEEGEQHRREANSCPNTGVSPEQDAILRAIRGGRRGEAIRRLGADPSLLKACDRDGGTPLHAAAEAADAELVGWLCGRRASASKADLKGWTPGDRAVRGVGWRERPKAARAIEALGALIRRGAPRTPLVAAALGDLDALAAVSDAELSAPLRDPYSGGLLSVAVKFNQPAVLRSLLDRGLDPDERVRLPDLEEPTFSWGGPLWHAAAYGEVEMATRLLDRGADPNGEVYASGTPLDRAYAARDEAMKALLLGRGATPSAATLALNADADAARAVLDGELGVRRDDPDDGLVAELCWGGTLGGSEAIVAMCLERLDWTGDDPRWGRLIGGSLGVWALSPHREHTAHVDRTAYPRMLAMYLEHGVDPNLPGRRGESLLHSCATCGVVWGRDLLSADERVARATILLDAGARLDVRDGLLCSTPLGWACRWGRDELAELYLDRGADPIEPDAEPWATPRAWAEKMGHAAIAHRLRGRSKRRATGGKRRRPDG